MSALSPDEPPSAANREVTPRGFRPKGLWPKLAQALEAFFIARTKHAVPEIELRRSRYEIKRCRRLMLAAAPAEVTAASAASRRAAHASGARS
jgi:hypothetical protein